jgi:hypothetical protein
VVAHAKGGSIVVFHMNENGPHTAEALPEVVKGLREKGFELVTVGEMLKRRDAETGRRGDAEKKRREDVEAWPAATAPTVTSQPVTTSLPTNTLNDTLHSSAESTVPNAEH